MTKEEKKIDALYKAYGDKSMSDKDFRHYCISVVRSGFAPNSELISSLVLMKKRDDMLMGTNNFLMKGIGHGVYSPGGR